MKYRKGYKYQLAEDEIFKTDFRPDENIQTEFVDLDSVGILTVKAGYAWDGASGPTIDTKNTMRGSLAHDALYQLIRNEWLPYTVKTRHMADDFMYKCLIEDGMFILRAKLWKRELKKFASFAADPKRKKKIFEAP